MKKLLAILASAFIIFACASSPKFPTDQSYSIAKYAPDWMVEFYLDDKTGKYGLLDWYGWSMYDMQYHMIKTDIRSKDGNLDGECDLIIFMVESEPEVCDILGTAPCEKWDEIKENILESLKKGSV